MVLLEEKKIYFNKINRSQTNAVSHFLWMDPTAFPWNIPLMVKYVSYTAGLSPVLNSNKYLKSHGKKITHYKVVRSTLF